MISLTPFAWSVTSPSPTVLPPWPVSVVGFWPMDAGVPLKRPVAGIAMGLIEDGDNHYVLSDILGSEDAHGDMDFK